nr:hypothetical protein [Evansella caseinilytica]
MTKQYIRHERLLPSSECQVAEKNGFFIISTEQKQLDETTKKGEQKGVHKQ